MLGTWPAVEDDHHQVGAYVCPYYLGDNAFEEWANGMGIMWDGQPSSSSLRREAARSIPFATVCPPAYRPQLRQPSSVYKYAPRRLLRIGQ